MSSRIERRVWQAHTTAEQAINRVVRGEAHTFGVASRVGAPFAPDTNATNPPDDGEETRFWRVGDPVGAYPLKP